MDRPPPEPVVGEPYVRPDGMPRAVMVDIDGTVALHHNVRGPYDTSRYRFDEPNTPVIELVRLLAMNERRIIFCTGREATFRLETQRWLLVNVGPVFNADLFMRPAGDSRNDAVVKLELFNEKIRHQYAVDFVLDDRDRVVKMWRSMGLTVLQVAEGDF